MTGMSHLKVCSGIIYPFDIFNVSSFMTELWGKPAFINLI
jgi:hypothetical protein